MEQQPFLRIKPFDNGKVTTSSISTKQDLTWLVSRWKQFSHKDVGARRYVE